ncbi:Mannonate dehydratase [Trichinella spiralis]|uniref:Mannonate dehydratase n=1 Tax=Trichinella spiralis TaxID=6334 RepID=A0ABR3KXR7_TRISP
MPVASIMQKAAGPMEDVHRTDKAPKEPTQSIEGFEHQKSVASISRDCTYICREALQVIQMWIEMDRLEELFQHQKKCKQERKLPKLRSRFVEKLTNTILRCGSKMMEWKNDSNFKTKSISKVLSNAESAMHRC